MGKRRKLYEKIVGGESDASVPFDRTRSLLLYLEFEERTRGSHHIFKRAGIQERVNLQPTREGTVKPYQVQQLRELLTRHELGEEL